MGFTDTEREAIKQKLVVSLAEYTRDECQKIWHPLTKKNPRVNYRHQDNGGQRINQANFSVSFKKYPILRSDSPMIKFTCLRVILSLESWKTCKSKCFLQSGYSKLKTNGN